MSTTEERRRDEAPKECVYKTKVIQFLGRTTPVILQNDNGPCPLLAICNVLLLKNNLNLNPDMPEVSQEKLLSLVAERLIDSNSNVSNKDAGYVENQQQNIADAIDLLPRLATGIDVNIKYRRIDDFEFTPECAVFDLLDIPLYHGWIVDPRDYNTANAIGSKSYNTLMEELVALEAQNIERDQNNNLEEGDSVDFAAATTATLGVPSPSLSRTMSFEDSPLSVSDQSKSRKGDMEEEAELVRVLKLSDAEKATSVSDPLVVLANDNSDNLVEITDKVQGQSFESQDVNQSEPSVSDDSKASSTAEGDLASSETNTIEAVEGNISKLGKDEHDQISELGKDEHDQSQSTSTSYSLEQLENKTDISAAVPPGDFDSSSGRMQHVDHLTEAFTPSIGGNEPIYEGEECILDAVTVYENREPVYEGEVVLAKQTDEDTGDAYDVNRKTEITPQQGEIISNFLKNSANQLTVYGLFCLQDGLKERELCVFFRNNHFSTMFKYEGELYLLATDQGYINQPDLVWEKLNEVNGDTLFMTGSFKEFKLEEDHAKDSWNEQNAMATTADYLSSIDKSAEVDSSLNSDLQLAIALQQQEFEQQPQRQNLQKPSTSGGSRLVTGPQVPRNNTRSSASTVAAKHDAKPKDKCTIM